MHNVFLFIKNHSSTFFINSLKYLSSIPSKESKMNEIDISIKIQRMKKNKLNDIYCTNNICQAVWWVFCIVNPQSNPKQRQKVFERPIF